MFTNSTILIGTDFSPSSDEAIKFGRKLIEKSNGTLHVVNVLDNFFEINFAVNETLNEIIKATEQRLKDQLQRCEVEATSEVIMGRPNKVLKKLITDKNIGLVILGHRGKDDDLFHIGGVTSKMVSTSPVPIFVVNQNEASAKIAGLVDTINPVKEVVEATEEMASLLGYKPLIVSLWQDISAQLSRRSPYLSESHIEYSEDEKAKIIHDMKSVITDKLRAKPETEIIATVTTEKKISKALVDLLEKDKINLVVMSRGHKGIVESYLVGSTTRSLLDQYRGNVLILPPQE